jgi:YesN/AraC family two-component response regulator
MEERMILPEGKCPDIILSGSPEFSFVVTSLSLLIKFYLVKPVTD